MQGKRLKKALAEIEDTFGEPRTVVHGTWELRRLGKDGWAIPAILVVTEEHAILKTKKEQRVIPLEKISAVTTKTGFFNKLVVQTSGEAIEMKNIALKKPELEHLGLVLQGFA